MCSGMDILTVDVIHEAASGREYILEVNGTSSGLAPDFAEEDNLHIRQLVLDRVNSLISAAAAGQDPPGGQRDQMAAADNDSSGSTSNDVAAVVAPCAANGGGAAVTDEDEARAEAVRDPADPPDGKGNEVSAPDPNEEAAAAAAAPDPNSA